MLLVYKQDALKETETQTTLFERLEKPLYYLKTNSLLCLEKDSSSSPRAPRPAGRWQMLRCHEPEEAKMAAGRGPHK